MQEKKMIIKEILTSIVFAGIIGTLSVLCLVMPKPEVLEAERRLPAKFPELSFESVFSGSFTDRFESWAADNFAFRDALRAVNSLFIFDVYRQSDKAGLYRTDDVGLGRLRHTGDEVIKDAAGRIGSAADTAGIPDGADVNVYYSIIPDKSEYAASFLPGFDTRRAAQVLEDELPGFTYIDITDTLDPGSYYKTDLHWDQSKIGKTADRLLSGMSAGNGVAEASIVSLPVGLLPGMGACADALKIAGEFSGIYAGEYALRTQKDTMAYIDMDMQGVNVSYLSSATLDMEAGEMYDKTRFAGIDPYDFFLRGPQPLIIIDNSNAPERELFMFRDSFGSSLSPLMIKAYSRVTLVDLRYIHISMLGRYIEIEPGSDVLFIYSPQILGNPRALQG